MKRSGRKRRSASQAETGGVSLFPFLAVLISTMGALIILLVVLTQQARRQAMAATKQRIGQVRSQIEAAAELLEWESETLRASREKTTSQLRDARLALGHLEEHSRRLQRRLAELESAWERLQETHHADSGRRVELADRLRRTEAEIARLETQLADRKRRAAEQASRYAIVPYEGPHGTERRPIYLECCKDAVVLQPEGIEFVPADFARPLGPGNPLEVALRAVREHYVQADSANGGQAAEPYPLLVVRPDGIASYYAARAALASWEGEIGYELVDGQWQLEFPPPNPALQREVAVAVTDARKRYRRLAALLSAQRRSKQPRYVVSPGGGGLVPESPGDVRFTEPGDYQQVEPQPPLGGAAPGAALAGRQRPAAGARQAEKPRPLSGDMHESVGAGSPGKQFASKGAESSAGDPPSQQAEAEGIPGGLSSIGGQSETASLALVRGKNWALPDAAASQIPVRRPIRIDCYPDRLVLVPERGLAGGAEIPLEGPTVGAVDQLVSDIWKYMEQWGSAGNGLYWRPVLSIYVAPGAERRLADLQRLLYGSGLIIERHEE